MAHHHILPLYCFFDSAQQQTNARRCHGSTDGEQRGAGAPLYLLLHAQQELSGVVTPRQPLCAEARKSGATPSTESHMRCNVSYNFDNHLSGRSRFLMIDSNGSLFWIYHKVRYSG